MSGCEYIYIELCWSFWSYSGNTAVSAASRGGALSPVTFLGSETRESDRPRLAVLMTRGSLMKAEAKEKTCSTKDEHKIFNTCSSKESQNDCMMIVRKRESAE